MEFFGQRDGRVYPVIVIPEGVRTPVAAKADLVDQGKSLIRLGDVYFRTLAANGTPSTAAARSVPPIMVWRCSVAAQ